MSTIEQLAQAAAEHADATSAWLAARSALISQARAHGHTWQDIADAAGMSRASVITIHQVASAKAAHPGA